MTTQFPVRMSSATSVTDIFSISDAHLAERYQFIREIGAGNWGCVWLCSPKIIDANGQSHVDMHQRVAVKLVFREKKPTTATRVRSLWNEMKIVRTLKEDPHPSIIPFHSFIITPSFAIITMDYLPHLIPVEVPESKARNWFQCLLSAVLFLHDRGIVHNDIKPANILLSKKSVPVLVDFGFAERYELGSKRAFLSNLAYGTPEYLSPERARGNLHDTRKSDVWSLGISFFEILVGRTPFEYVEGEKFVTPEDLELYWSRTVKGKWVGKYRMSKSAERLLRRMIAPNADIRCTASEAMSDVYWADISDAESCSDVQFEPPARVPVKTPTKPRKVTKENTTSMDKENRPPPTKRAPVGEDARTRAFTRSARRSHQQLLSPIEGSPASAQHATARAYGPASTYSAPRMPVHKGRAPGIRKPLPFGELQNKVPTKDVAANEKDAKAHLKKIRAGHEVSDRSRNVEVSKRMNTISGQQKAPRIEPIKQQQTRRFGSGSYDRMLAFERLKQLERSRFLEEDDEPTEESREPSVSRKPSFYSLANSSTARLSSKADKRSMSALAADRQMTASSSFTMLSYELGRLAALQNEEAKALVSDTLYRTPKDSAISIFKQNLRLSIDKTLERVIPSNFSRTDSCKPKEEADKDNLDLEVIHRESWEDDTLIRQAKSSLPVVHYALRSEQVAADNNSDRMAIWVRNVEQIVKEAAESFASSSIRPLPPLPARPAPRGADQRIVRSARAARKIVPVDQIFYDDDPDAEASATTSQGKSTVHEKSAAARNSFSSSNVLNQEMPVTPSRARRATISVGSPELLKKASRESNVSPSNRREKSKSSGNLTSLVRPISPFNQIVKELQKDEEKVILDLSAVLDRNDFVARAGSSAFKRVHLNHSPLSLDEAQAITESLVNAAPIISTTSPSVLHESSSSPLLNTPGRKHLEGVYGRFRLATSSVKRTALGFQADMSAPANVQHAQTPSGLGVKNRNSRLFGIRRATPPTTLTNESQKLDGNDDLGKFMTVSSPCATSPKDENNKSVRAVAKAFKAIMTGKAVARRQQTKGM